MADAAYDKDQAFTRIRETLGAAAEAFARDVDARVTALEPKPAAKKSAKKKSKK